jgi:hypothetical protein
MGGDEMSVQAFPNPMAPIPAVRQVWTEQRELVDRLALRWHPGGAIEQSYYVLVFCDRADVDPEELANGMRRLERLVEERSGLDVALTLALPPGSTNGTHD